MNGWDIWDIAVVIIISGSLLYLFVHMMDCFLNRLNDYKRGKIKW